jgi:hypothetical protein
MPRSVVQLEISGREKYTRLFLAQGRPAARRDLGLQVRHTVVLPNLVLPQIGGGQF